ncbi:hypothetical protein [Streptomyces cellulosae]|uniref:hypothetical protein n=1 Tax=Streptomyces cellulosae TaxID=1968 RepID=UPI0004C7950A|nr:hypothetical protein [Streptomyces cellulosae]
MSDSQATRESKHRSRRRLSPEGWFVKFNATVLTLHLVLVLAARPQLATETAGHLTVGVLLLLGQGLLLLSTALRYTAVGISGKRSQT